ncbi:methionyl-tRNA formyltransferase [Trifolium repens]|nr:methionyl-tRNA formyltransferase [Trifolium repens]
MGTNTLPSSPWLTSSIFSVKASTTTTTKTSKRYFRRQASQPAVKWWWLDSQKMIRRLLCVQNQSASSPSSLFSSTSTTTNNKKKSVVLLGAPQVSTIVLDALLTASASPHSSFEVAAIVTQPAARRDRGKKLTLSPLANYALERGFSSHLIFTPQRAGDDTFLSDLKALEPQLCITAAYGNILPTKFLDIPSFGTVNIHPSILPFYRGAAPVQRALQDGVKETGVSLAFTVLALDAGPIITTETIQVDQHIKAPDLLELLFHKGSKLLIRELPSIFDGSAREKAQPQDDSKATLAPKISPDESWLFFDQEAFVLHNKVRAFSGWPGSRAKILVVDKNGQKKTLEIKIITTRVCTHESVQFNEADDIAFVNGALVFPCGRGTTLEVLEIQLPGKKVVNAAAFWNGLRGQKLKKL